MAAHNTPGAGRPNPELSAESVAPEFVLEQVENPHPKMLTGAVAAREQGGDFWNGYLQAMADATGESPEDLIAWMERVA